MNQIPEEEDQEKDDVSDRAAARRAKRSEGRSQTRAPRLRRKSGDSTTEPVVEEKTEEKTEPVITKKPTRAKAKTTVPRKKPVARKKTTTVTAKKTTVKKTIKPVAAPKEEYELRSHPDGTLIRVKITDQGKPKRATIPRRRTTSEEGPGPATAVHYTLDQAPDKRNARDLNIESLQRKTARSVAYLERQLGKVPKTAVILGSGHAGAAELARDNNPVEFADVPGFSVLSVPGHPGLIRAGEVDGAMTLFCEGRLHYYETGSMEDVVYPIQTFMALGVERVILTTSAGGLNPDYRTGDVMFVTDHINLAGDNPFFGHDPRAVPSVFVDGANIYDKTAVETSERVCRRARVNYQKGVLASVRGPVYETPAERRMLRQFGADAVCMSVAPEALAARHAGVRVAAMAMIVNDASHDNGNRLTHEDVVSSAERNVADLTKALAGLLNADW